MTYVKGDQRCMGGVATQKAGTVEQRLDGYLSRSVSRGKCSSEVSNDLIGHRYR